MAKSLKGKNLWDSLDGAKEELKETVEVELGDVKGEVTVCFREVDMVREIEQKYNEKLPQKPQISKKGIGKIDLPSEEFPQFNDHPDAIEWQNKAEKINRKKAAHLALKFIDEEERPDYENEEEGAEILLDRLRFMDISRIVNKGMKIMGISDRLEEARKNS